MSHIRNKECTGPLLRVHSALRGYRMQGSVCNIHPLQERRTRGHEWVNGKQSDALQQSLLLAIFVLETTTYATKASSFASSIIYLTCLPQPTATSRQSPSRYAGARQPLC